MINKKPYDVEQVGGMLGEGVVMEGTLTFPQTFRIDGEFRGKILKSDRLVVGEKGKVTGEVDVNALVVYGRIDGTVRVKGPVEIDPKGFIAGDLTMSSQSLTIMEGGFIEGTIKMEKKQEPLIATIPAAKPSKP